MGNLYALDFDGVLCDSCGESSLSAVKVRPVVETGCENLLLVRLLLESQVPSIRTSSGRFADALLRELAGVMIPSDRIFGLGSGFVEDRIATLKNVIKDPELDGWNLYLVNWGYSTQKERDEAGSIPRINVLELSDFSEKLK